MTLAHQVDFWFELADSAYTQGFIEDYDRAMTMAWKKEDELCKAMIEDERAFENSYDFNEEEAIMISHGRYNEVMANRNAYEFGDDSDIPF
jgi:xylose isomerase